MLKSHEMATKTEPYPEHISVRGKNLKKSRYEKKDVLPFHETFSVGFSVFNRP